MNVLLEEGKVTGKMFDIESDLFSAFGCSPLSIKIYGGFFRFSWHHLISFCLISSKRYNVLCEDFSVWAFLDESLVTRFSRSESATNVVKLEPSESSAALKFSSVEASKLDKF